MAETVYTLCALMSAACAVLLMRAWLRTRLRLLLYSGLCFVWLTINNSVLLVDLVLLPEFDLSLVRSLTALGGAVTLLYGLIWDVS